MLGMSKHWNSKRDIPVTVVSYYWHFVDWIWLLIFSLGSTSERCCRVMSTKDKVVNRIAVILPEPLPREGEHCS